MAWDRNLEPRPQARAWEYWSTRLKKAGDVEAAAKLFTEQFEPTSAAYLAGVQSLVEMQHRTFDASAERVQALRVRATTVLVVVGLLSVVIGAAHAGWRGALTGVLEATLAAMEKLGATRADVCDAHSSVSHLLSIMAAIGAPAPWPSPSVSA